MLHHLNFMMNIEVAVTTNAGLPNSPTQVNIKAMECFTFGISFWRQYNRVDFSFPNSINIHLAKRLGKTYDRCYIFLEGI